MITLLVRLLTDLAEHALNKGFSNFVHTVSSQSFFFLAWQNRYAVVRAFSQLLESFIDQRVEVICEQTAQDSLNWMSLPGQCNCVLFKPIMIVYYHKVSEKARRHLYGDFHLFSNQ